MWVVTDENFLEAVCKYRDETNLTNQPTHMAIKAKEKNGTQASINFIVPVNVPEFFYNHSLPATNQMTILEREEFIDSMPDAFHETLSHQALTDAIAAICEPMQGKERFIRASAGSLFIASAGLLVLIVDETGKELPEEKEVGT